MEYATLEDTVYFYFAVNDTSGSGVDGSTPLFDVRLAGAAASAAPVLSGTPDLLTHANYGPGVYEVAVAAETGNGFAATEVYGVFVTVTADGQTPAACVGKFKLDPVKANLVEISDDAPAAVNAEAFFDGTGYAGTNNVMPTVTTLTGHTAQTGDTYALANGATGFAAIDTVVDGIQTDLSNGTDGLGAIKATADAIETDTQNIQGRLPAALVNSRMDATVDATGMEAGAVTNILTTQMTESYAANGVAPTLAQAQFAIHQMLQQFGIAGTALTVRQLDDTTTAFVVTLDSASAPTDAKRV